jgi:mono/diheme cytochrome c family protein
MRRAVVLVAITFGGAGCDGLPGPDLARMIRQDKVVAYAEPMRRPPAGTVPHDAIVGQLGLTTGEEGGRFVTEFPLPLTRALVEQGRRDFAITCAACHGPRGDGDSAVAPHFELRAPPSLLKDDVRRMPVGRIFRIVSGGYGLMPAYDVQLDEHQRWGVVAFVRALQLSQAVSLQQLPPELREAAATALEGSR